MGDPPAAAAAVRDLGGFAPRLAAVSDFGVHVDEVGDADDFAACGPDA
ncbi:hypothetical protein [Mycolicibacterium alvei]|nr:hypothetical protein [Mycolicibacterium alvei]